MHNDDDPLERAFRSFAARVTDALAGAFDEAISTAAQGADAHRAKPDEVAREVAQKQRRPVPPITPPAKTRAASRSTSTRNSAPITHQALLAELARRPRQRMEELAASLQTTTKAIGPVMRVLVGEGTVQTSGKARGTTYAIAEGKIEARRPHADAPAPAHVAVATKENAPAVASLDEALPPRSMTPEEAFTAAATAMLDTVHLRDGRAGTEPAIDDDGHVARLFGQDIDAAFGGDTETIH